MAEQDVKQAFLDAILDADSLEQFINGDDSETVLTRLSAEYPTLQNAIKKMFENGGLPAVPKKTYADLSGSGLAEGDYAVVTDDPIASKNGLYVISGGVWVKSDYDPVGQAKIYTDSATNKQIGTALSHITPSFNINTAAGLFESKGNARLFQNGTSQSLPVVSTPLPATNGTYRVEYNKSNSTISLIVSNAAISGNIIFGQLIVDSGGYQLKGVGNYSIDDIEQNNGYLLGKLLTSSASTVNLDVADKKLKINTVGRIFADGGHNYLTPDASIPLPTTAGVYRIEYMTATKSFAFELTSNAPKFGRICIGSLVFISGQYSLHGFDLYSVSGEAVKAGGGALSGQLLAQQHSDINFDFANNTITIAPNKVRMIMDGKTTLLSGQVINHVPDKTKGWYYLTYSKADKTFSTRRVTRDLLSNTIIVGYFDNTTNTVEGIPYYSINGSDIKERSSLENAAIQVPYGNFSNDYIAPELDALKPLYDLHDKNLTSFYGLYDALVAEHPDYVAMTVLGADVDGNEIRQYKFSAPQIPSTGNLGRPKIILAASVHGGGEKHGTFNLYNAMRTICEDWRTDPTLAAIRWGVDIVTVPVAVPYVFINNGRKNKNGVDIARNFTNGWTLGADPSANTYGGPTPLSELEAQILDAVMTNNKDAILFSSLHGFSALSSTILPEGQLVWNASATDFGESLAKSLITSATIDAKGRYPWISQDASAWIGYADRGAPKGSEGMQATYHGIQGGTFEVGGTAFKEVGQPYLSSAVTTIITQLLINWIVYNVRHATQYYNAKVKL